MIRWFRVSLLCSLSFYTCLLQLNLGLSNGLKLFYLAADSVTDATSTVVLAESFVRATGSEKHQEERRKTGMFKATELCLNHVWNSSF